MALATVVYTERQNFPRFDSDGPIWPNRDRFALSNGHASMLLYAMLYLTGVKAMMLKYERLGEPSVTLSMISNGSDSSGASVQGIPESQIYRIDHDLGKETVQNIMVFRFANGMFEPLWNRDHIDHVQIIVAEGVGVEERGKFSDATGALRDMVPNHLFQLLTLLL